MTTVNLLENANFVKAKEMIKDGYFSDIEARPTQALVDELNITLAQSKEGEFGSTDYLVGLAFASVIKDEIRNRGVETPDIVMMRAAEDLVAAGEIKQREEV